MFRAVNNEKLGNVLVYLSSEIPDLTLTKALKLIYLLDERSISESGVPITWLDYNAWKMGPVPRVLYEELRFGKPEVDEFGQHSLQDHIFALISDDLGEKTVTISPKKPFNDGSFCDYEIDLLKQVVDEYGSAPSSQLIALTHRADGSWDEAVHYHRLDQLFNIGVNVTGQSVDLSIGLAEEAKAAYLAAIEAMEFKTSLLRRGNQHG